MPEKNQLFWLFFSLKGRISPGVYFLAGLLLLTIRGFLLYRLALSPQDSAEQADWAGAFLAAVFISMWSNIALTGKRLHDFGKPAPWALITIIVDFTIFFVLPFVKGDPGPNKYGTRTNAPA